MFTRHPLTIGEGRGKAYATRATGFATPAPNLAQLRQGSVGILALELVFKHRAGSSVDANFVRDTLVGLVTASVCKMAI